MPSILTADPIQIRTWLRQIQEQKRFKKVQIDFVDGEFANNRTVKPDEVGMYEFLNLDFEAHMMVVEKNIAEYVKLARNAGFDKVVVQLESVANPGLYSGLALDIHSPVEAIKPYLEKLDEVVVMAVEPGFGGQKFVTAAVGQVMELARLRRENGFKYRISVDGGVEEEQLEYLAGLEVDEVAVGAKRALEMRI